MAKKWNLARLIEINGRLVEEKHALQERVVTLLDALDEAEKETKALVDGIGKVNDEGVKLRRENTRLRDALKSSESELQITCSCCKLFKDCHLPCRLNDIRKANKVALTQKGGNSE